MKKIICVIFTFISLAVVFSACGGETYTEKLKKQKKAIDRFIDEKNIDLIYEYPANGVFAENQYFKDKSGIYFRVINTGNDDKPVSGKTDIYLRYKDVIDLMTKDTIGNNELGTAIKFRYGITSTYVSTNTSDQAYFFLSAACVLPLDHGLGNNAEVSLIIPSTSGSKYQSANFKPFYYGVLRYRFVNDESGKDK